MVQLFSGITKDDGKSAHISKKPLNVADNKFTTLKVGATGRRMDAKVRIRQKLPDDALAFEPPSAAMCPDVTQGMIRCVELDLKKWVNKTINVRGGGRLQEEAIHQRKRTSAEVM